jgi:N-acetylglucosaminyltransferase
VGSNDARNAGAVFDLTVVPGVYITVALTYSRLQRRFSDARRRLPAPTAPKTYLPSVDVIVPCYNENPELLAACLRSLRYQEYRGTLRVWVVDDGSGNREALLPVVADHMGAGWRFLALDRNLGKREAQVKAIREGTGTILLTIDSDTVIDSRGVTRIVGPFADGRVGAVTGNLWASNRQAGWMIWLINRRYRLLFERERAAQSFFGAVLCCAGPFSAYRREAVEKVLERYRAGRTPGDDLRLTNLVLDAGYRSLYEPTAKGATNVPATLPRFFRQQVRWNRSFYRELPRMLRLLAGRNRPFELGRTLYLGLDLAARTLLPPLLATTLATTVADALLDPADLPWDLAAIVAMALASVDLGPSPLRWVGWRFAVSYGLVAAVILLPARLWAACTVSRNSWGTRGLPGHWRTLASNLRTSRSPASLPFSLYRLIARSSSLTASPRRPLRRRTSARSTRASASESN